MAERRLDVDCFDVIEDLRLDGVGLFPVFTARTLWAPLAGAWPAAVASTAFIIEALQAHWKRNGLPKFAQFDNDVRFQGGHNHPDVIGRVMRLCLALGVTPVFVPPLEMGFQGIMENFNGLWRQKVWARFHHESMVALAHRSQRFTLAYCQHLARLMRSILSAGPFPPTLKWIGNSARADSSSICAVSLTKAPLPYWGLLGDRPSVAASVGSLRNRSESSPDQLLPLAPQGTFGSAANQDRRVPVAGAQIRYAPASSPPLTPIA